MNEMVILLTWGTSTFGKPTLPPTLSSNLGKRGRPNRWLDRAGLTTLSKPTLLPDTPSTSTQDTRFCTPPQNTNEDVDLQMQQSNIYTDITCEDRKRLLMKSNYYYD
jgi:hypothetical protein